MKKIYIIGRMISATLLLIASSRFVFEIPISSTGIPITGQSLAVILVIYLLKPHINSLAIALYLLLGIIGLPVFADGSSGLSVLIGKSGGYLYGFLCSSVIMNLYHVRLKQNFAARIVFLLLATMYILLFGWLHLSFHIGFQMAFEYGIQPYLAGAAIKLLIAILIIQVYEIFKSS